MRIFSLICLLAALVFSSCSLQRKASTGVNYLERSKDTTGKEPLAMKPPVIQKNDLLSIKVFSDANGIEPKVDAPYNLQETGAGSTTGSTGFLVDQLGNIEYPQIGVVHAEGLTREELAALIKSKLPDGSVLNNPSVIVRFLNYKVTVLGEVNSPGSFTFPTERVTILDALGLSGDITQFGKKNNVMVIRENNGQIERGRIDLTSSGMFSSPYYQLQQNDVVYVESNGKRQRQQDRQDVAQQIGLATSVITAIALILNFIK